jgi:hypothetical protein
MNEHIIAGERDAAWLALTDIAEGDTCLRGLPDAFDLDDEDQKADRDALIAAGDWPCVCAHHWATYALAAAYLGSIEDSEVRG